MSIFWSAISFALPSATVRPPTVPVTPLPVTEAKSVGSSAVMFFSLAAAMTAAASSVESRPALTASMARRSATGAFTVIDASIASALAN
jgi:hypothetical protein